MTIIFGQFTTKFTGFVSSSGGEQAAQEFRENVNNFVLWFVYLFAARFVVVYISNVTVSIAAIRTTRSIRRTFLEKTLRQEIWHFDKQSIGSVSSQVTTSKFWIS
jgi:ATP-binding cassette subfamily B (MDR/TAP) protein 1